MVLAKQNYKFNNVSAKLKENFYIIQELKFLLFNKKLKNKLLKLILEKFNELNGKAFKFFLFKNKLLFSNFNNLFFNFLYNNVKFLKKLKRSTQLFKNFYRRKFKQCAIVKAFFNFTNTFLLLTNLKGEIKNWVSAGTGKFFTKFEKSVPQVPIALSFRISNIISRKKFKYIKINYIGPSRRYRNKVFISLKNRSWVRGYKLVCIEEGYKKAFNGCRKRRLKRK
jgi:ribosomal protein S11